MSVIFNKRESGFYDDYFSNFVPAEITVFGETFPTVEHAYQSRKSTNPAVQKHIAESRTPGVAQRRGRQAVMCREDWDAVKYDIMVSCLREKFKIENFREVLLRTGDEEICESAEAWNDDEWGLGKAGDGKNLLGKALMQVRKEIQDGNKD